MKDESHVNKNQLKKEYDSYVPDLPGIKPDVCPKCGGHIWGVEYDPMDADHYDGVSEWSCENALWQDNSDGKGLVPPTCDWRIGRFCGERLDMKAFEPRYCGGGAHPVHTYENKKENN